MQIDFSHNQQQPFGTMYQILVRLAQLTTRILLGWTPHPGSNPGPHSCVTDNKKSNFETKSQTIEAAYKEHIRRGKNMGN